jgi:hypothetical protein
MATGGSRWATLVGNSRIAWHSLWYEATNRNRSTIVAVFDAASTLNTLRMSIQEPTSCAVKDYARKMREKPTARTDIRSLRAIWLDGLNGEGGAPV